MSEKLKLKSMKEKQVLQRANELVFDTDRLGAGSLMVQQSHVNSSRVIMSNHQLTHAVSIKNPEMPLIPTGFENVLASYSSMNEQADADYEIVAKFEKNPYNFVLIGFDKKARRYHAWQRVELEEHSEGFCTRYNNNFIDGLEIGDVVKEGDYIHKSSSFDKHMNYQYGKNLNTVYLVSAQVLEDGILAMNNVDHMMNTYRYHKQTINLGENEIMLNWYGDDESYQPLPKIGEKIRNNILAIVRRIDNAKAPYALKKKRLRVPERGDRKYWRRGRVIDIDILYNYKDKNNMADVGANKMLKDMFDHQQDYYMRLYKYMRGIIDRAGDEGYTYTDEFSTIIKHAQKFVDSSIFFTDSNDNMFGNIQIKVHIMDEEKLSVGSKLVGRSGNKGVISRILPPEESWHMEDGRPIHLAVAALGIVGRLNQSQMNEHSINELSNTAVEMMKMTPDLDQKIHIVYRLMKYLNSKEAEAFKKFSKKLSSDKKEKFCRRIEREGIIIIQEPIDNANIFDIGEAYEEFPANWQRIVFPDGKMTMRKLLCAKMFYMRLKQDPLDKYSVRSRGPVNPLTTLPAKSSLKKKGLAPFSDVPVRFGEYEIEVLLAMVNHPAAVADYMCESSTSWPAKMVLAEQTYMGDPDEDVDMSEIDFNGKKNMEQITAYTNILSMRPVFELEEAPDGEWFTD